MSVTSHSNTGVAGSSPAHGLGCGSSDGQSTENYALISCYPL